MPTRPPVHQAPGTVTRAQFDKQRRPQHDKTYDHQWRKLSKQFRQQHPLCAHCLANGIVKEADEVDHVIPVVKAPERRLDWSGLQSLCSSCHAKKTYRETIGLQRAKDK